MDAELTRSLSQQVDIKRIFEIARKSNLLEKSIAEEGDWSKLTFYHPGGCSRCHQEGYKGRIGIYEVLEVSEEIAHQVAGRATSDDINDLAKKEGMLTMIEDGIIKAIQGITSIEEILRVTED